MANALILAGISELCPPSGHTVTPELAALHQLYCSVCSLSYQLIRHLTETQLYLEFLLPHPSQGHLKLAKFILCVEADEPQSLVDPMVIRLEHTHTHKTQ